MSFVKNLFGGKKGPQPYSSANTGQYETGLGEMIANRAGAKATKDAKGNITYDYSQAGKPITGAEGIKTATAGYDYSPMQEAVAGYRKPGIFKQSYTPTKFNFKGLPQQFGDMAYNQGAKNILRQGAGDLQRTKESIGVRRPGLLLKAANDNRRQVGENLAAMQNPILLEQMRSNVDQERAEQEGNAGENYRGYQSQSDLEKSNEDNRVRNLEGLSSTGQNIINTQEGQVQNERAYNDEAIGYLQNLFSTAMGSNQQAAQIGQQQKGGTLDFLKGIGKIAGKAGSMYLASGGGI